MEASTRKIVLPLVVAFVASLVVTAVIIGPGRPAPVEDPATSTEQAVTAPSIPGSQPDTPGQAASVTKAAESGVVIAGDVGSIPPVTISNSNSTTKPDLPVLPQRTAEPLAVPSTDTPTNLPPLPERETGWGALTAMAPDGTLADRGSVTPIGSLDPLTELMQIDFATQSAGISKITFSNFWRTSEDRRQAQSHRNAVAAGSTDPPPMPADDQRYVLQTAGMLYSGDGVAFETPILAVHSLRVTGWGETAQDVVLFGDVWSQVAPGHFKTDVHEAGTDELILTIHRRFTLPVGRYDITLQQVVTNHSDRPLRVQWRQFGPGDLALDETTYLKDIRRFHFGYLMNASRDPSQTHVLHSGMMLERNSAIGMAEEYASDPLDNMLWPTESAREDGFALSWFGSTTRYFALCIHAPYELPESPSKQLSAVESINPVVGGTVDEPNLLTSLIGRMQQLDPGASVDWDMGVFAGPLERSVLNVAEPYVALNMGGLILYLMSGCCSFCTFAWLANFMIIFLSFIHSICFDWGISIIFLVIVVRTLLHPITRKGQISMQKNAKAMGDLKPELDEIKKRYADEPEKQRKEQMRLMQEKGMNPLGCGGAMLPMFLQMPIWIALYAVLFFAFELRQEWAFYGFFQMFDGWAFMGNLSAPDNFIDFGVSYDLWFFEFSGINLLPLLMGFVFFFQQKYMTPPPSANMSEDQLRQQKMMKVMMLVLFPLMLYGAPSGLTLYILTSSIIGTLESRYIRGHIKKIQDEAEKNPVVIGVGGDGAAPKGQKKQDSVGKMYEKMLDSARKRQDQKKQKKKTFKKR
jgi:YidC/Oxa1 family membrane protein insertase